MNDYSYVAKLKFANTVLIQILRKFFQRELKNSLKLKKKLNFVSGDKHIDIQNWPLQSFSQDCGLVSHTTHIVCINFIRKW